MVITSSYHSGHRRLQSLTGGCFGRYLCLSRRVSAKTRHNEVNGLGEDDDSIARLKKGEERC